MERARARERESMFFGSAPEADNRFLWSEVSPTWERVLAVGQHLANHNALKPSTEPAKMVEFYSSFPVELRELSLPVGETGTEVFRLREWNSTNKQNIFLAKWVLQSKAAHALPVHAPALDVAPPAIATEIRMAMTLEEDEQVEKELDQQIAAVATPSAMDELQAMLQRKKRQDLSGLPTYDAPTAAPKFISTEGLPPGVSEEEYARQQDQQSLKDKLGLK